MNIIHIRDIPGDNEIDAPDHTYLESSWAKGYLDLNVHNFDPYHDILVKENVHSDEFIRVYLKYFNPNKNFCSHVLLMDNGVNRFLLTDAAMNVEPTLTDFVKIIENAMFFWQGINHMWGDDVIHVNFLNYSGNFSIKNKDAITANNLKAHFEVERPGEILLTDWQLDSCLYADSRNKKYCECNYPPAIIVVPNISVGNAIYKCLMKEYKCYGFLVGGSRVAVLNSRSDLDKNDECIKIITQKGIKDE